ncbi:transcription factor IIIB 90 kDa [Nesidiocoris tenuis]|uniref:B-related factor 1 n=1 Tax=Nesidiocoris tenuis TaxID=355587 RepID=A0ABN7A738_9HEMI|nr:transcription factor IIIB 90 kDa [Nesidiocoris tenuis]
MGAGGKCKSCGSSTLEVDPSRGDTVCTTCGTVLEDSVIVSEVQYEDNSHGISTAIGQFVSSESSGGCRGFGNGFHAGGTRESREITLQNAKKAISNLCQNLRLNQHCLDTAFNFYKMALNRNLTRGRKLTHVIAACVYITCRTEGTPHLLIDFSDVLQICAFELGRTYVKISQALCINIPAADPCLYVLRFANKLEFGDKTHEVTMTALRLVQRMKKDSIHYGRRPSGVCGAALLMAARLHQFSRSVGDIVKVVQVHETTLRKRLVEFGETPSSSLSLTEFMSVDLEEAQDPPSYKSARAKDRARLQELVEDKASLKEFNQLKLEIERHIGEKRKRKFNGELVGLDGSSGGKHESEEEDFNKFVNEATLDVLEDLEEEEELREMTECGGLGPNLQTMGLTSGADGSNSRADIPFVFNYETLDGELDLEGLDDEELSSYINTDNDSERKTNTWKKLNADYLKAKEEKEERLKKELAEGKTPSEKKKRKNSKKKSTNPANSAGEAIEKMLQEKKISTKINYDVLKSLTIPKADHSSTEVIATLEGVKAELVPKEEVLSGLKASQKDKKASKPGKNVQASSSSADNSGIGTIEDVLAGIKTTYPDARVSIQEVNPQVQVDDELDDDEEVEEPGAGEDVMTMAQMLNQHNDNDDGDDYYDYDDDY